MFNPVEILKSKGLEILEGIMLTSYQVCLIGGLTGLILFVFGWKKGKDIAFISPAIYIIIRILGGVISGV